MASSRHLLKCLPMICSSTPRFGTLNSKVKLGEIPDICTREDWGEAINESRMLLQKYSIKPSFVNRGMGRISLQTVIKRMEEISQNNDNYLIHTFKQLLSNTDDTANELRWPGLVTLMLAKSIGYPFEADNFVSKSLEDVIWSSQVTLAEIINLLHCNLVFRKEIFRLSLTKKISKNSGIEKELDKMVYNYLTSIVLYKASVLNNYKVVQLIADILECLVKTRQSSTTNILLKNLKEWEYNTFHSQGLLLASGCQATLQLAGYDEASQKMAFTFGRNFAFAIKAHAEIQQHWNYQNSRSSTINISSFPIALHLQNHPETLPFVYSRNEIFDNADIDMLHTILQTNSAMRDAKMQLEIYIKKALGILQQLQKSGNDDVTVNLIKLVNTLCSVNEF